MYMSGSQKSCVYELDICVACSRQQRHCGWHCGWRLSMWYSQKLCRYMAHHNRLHNVVYNVVLQVCATASLYIRCIFVQQGSRANYRATDLITIHERACLPPCTPPLGATCAATIATKAHQHPCGPAAAWGRCWGLYIKTPSRSSPCRPPRCLRLLPSWV